MMYRAVIVPVLDSMRQVVGFVEGRLTDPCVEAHMVAQPIVVRTTVGVPSDLVAGSEQPRPPRVLREGERIRQAGDVNRNTGIGVVPPGATEVGSLLEDDEIVEPGLLEFDRCPDARKAGADHDDLVIEPGIVLATRRRRIRLGRQCLHVVD